MVRFQHSWHPGRLFAAVGLTLALWLLAAVLPHTAYAGSCSWTGAVNSDWNTAGNWGPGCTGGIPGSADTVDIPAGLPNDPNISGSITVHGLSVNGTLSLLADATLSTGGDLIVNGTLGGTSGSSSLYLYGSTVTNNGTISIRNVYFEELGGAKSILGTGVWTGNGEFVTRADVTLAHDTAMAFSVFLFNANLPTIFSFNDHVLTLTSPTTLLIYVWGTVNFGNQPFTISAPGGSSFSNIGTVSGTGTVRTQGTVSLFSGNGLSLPLSVLSGTTTAYGPFSGAITVANGAILQVAASQALFAYGDLTVNGIVSEGDSFSTLEFRGNTLTNNGTVSIANVYFSGGSAQTITGTGAWTGNGLFETRADVTLANDIAMAFSSFQFNSSFSTTFTFNNHVLTLTSPTTLAITVYGTVNIGNQPFTISAPGGSSFANYGTLSGTGVVQTQGMVSLYAATNNFSPPLEVLSGTTTARGTFNGAITVANGAILQVAASNSLYAYGDLTVNGTVSGGSFSSLEFRGSTLTNNGNITTVANVYFASTSTLQGTGSFIGNTASILYGATVTLGSDHQMSKVVVGGGGTFNLNGHTLGLSTAGTPLTNNGTFNATNSTVSYDGTAAQTVATANVDYTNLTIDNPVGVTLSSAESVPGVLALKQGVFTNGDNLTLGSGATIVRSGGSLAATPAFEASVNVQYAGHSAITSGPELPAATSVLANLTNNNTATVNLNQDQTVNGVFTLAAGAFNVGAYTLTLKGTVSASAGVLASATTGMVAYAQSEAGQAVLATQYGNLTFNASGKVLPSSGVVRVAGVFTAPAAAGHTLTGSTVEFNGASAQLLPAGFPTYNNLTLNNAAGATGVAGLSVNSLLRVQAGTFTTASDFNHVQIDPGATLNAGGDMTVSGDWTNQGTFTPNTRTVTFDGGGSQAIAGATTFYNLTIANTAATPSDSTDVDSDTALTVQNALNVNDGQFQPQTGSSFNPVTIGVDGILKPDSGGALTVNGDFTNNGSFVRNAGMLTFAGTTSIAGSSATTLHHATITGSLTAPAGILSMTGNFTNSGVFAHGNGTLRFISNALQNLTLNSPAAFFNLTVTNGTTLVETVAADNATVAGTLTNQGIIRKSRAVAGAGAVSFGLTGASANVTTAGSLSQVQVDRVDQNQPSSNTLTATGRYWTITPTGAGYTVDLTLLRPAVVTSNALACRNGVSEWNCTCSSATATTVTRNGVTQFSDWAVGMGASVTSIQGVASRWGAATGNPNYDLLFDMDRNGVIDIRDVTLVASLWNAGC